MRTNLADDTKQNTMGERRSVCMQGTSSGYLKGFVTFELMLVTLTLDFSNVEIRAMQVLLVIVRLFWVIHN